MRNQAYFRNHLKWREINAANDYFPSFNDKFLSYLLIYYYIFREQTSTKFMILANVEAFPLLPKNQSLSRGQARGIH